jgi:hypothetical protein
MKKLNDTQKDFIGGAIAFTLFWSVIGYFAFTQPDYSQTNKTPQIVKKQTQSPVLQKYGALITKNK